jgi:hypothetical protein
MTTSAAEMEKRFTRLIELSFDVGADYAEVARELEWLESCPLEHARPGFEYWYAGFKRVPSVHTMAQVDAIIEELLWSDSPHTCTNLHTVNIAMRCLMNALMARFADIYCEGPHSDAQTAVKIAMGVDVSDEIGAAWRDHLTAAAARRGIADVEAFVAKREAEAVKRIEEGKK